MTLSFNLLDESWIPCIKPDGSFIELSLRDTLLQAHNLSEIYCDSPPTTLALHRPLLAILHRVFGPKNRDAWLSLWQIGQWDEQKLDEYLDNYRPYFNLFDKVRPFYQVAHFPPGAGQEARPIGELIHEIASGNNASLFDHHSDLSPETVSLAEVARRLITVQAFVIGFGISHKLGKDTISFRDGPCARGATFLVQGENLFQTLLLNMRQHPDTRSRLPDEPDNDKPAWEMENSFINRDEPLGYLDYLTWQSLRIRLVLPEEDYQLIHISYVHRIQGLGLNKKVLDPLKSYYETVTGSRAPLGFKEDKALWRDSVSLFELEQEDSYNAPEPFRLLARLVREQKLSRSQRFRYLAFGLTTEEGKARNVSLWRCERMPLPLRYLDDPNLVSQLRASLKLAEDVNAQLESVRDWLAWLLLKPNEVRDLYDIFKQKDKEYLNRYKNKGFTSIQAKFNISRHYWWRLEEPFRRTMTDLTDETKAEPAMRNWVAGLRQAARLALAEIVAGLDGSTRALKATVKAKQELERGLGRVLKIQKTIGGNA